MSEIALPHDDAHDWIARNADRLVRDLTEACRIPSIASTDEPSTVRMGEWLRSRLDEVLDTVRLEPTSTALPLVIGHARGRSDRTLLLYTHYDVQPADEGWTSEPFEPLLTEGKLIARGVADDKADILARLHALEALRAIGEELPCSIVWLSEGAEEIGSPGLAEVIERNRDELSADGCLWESYLRRPDGRPEIGFGARGNVYLELHSQLLSADQHSAFAGVFRSAPIELIHAIASMVDTDGRVLIDGLMDATAALPEQARAAAAAIEPPEPAEIAREGIRAWVDRPASELGARMVSEPTVNVAGMGSGYSGEGSMTIVPASAWAKIDIRTIGGQSAEFVLDRVREHLVKHGFDIEVRLVHSIPASTSAMDSPFARAVIEASKAAFGEPVLYPLVPGSGPLHLVSETLGIDIIAPPGSTRLESAIHGPDESIAIADYLAHVEYTVNLIRSIGRHWAGS